ncbi:MAG: hypothetical protein ACRDPI_10140 [Nocardioidaceae bacterium]
MDPIDRESTFHDDCWQSQLVDVQDRYRDQVREQGVLGLISAYLRSQPTVVEPLPLEPEPVS